MEKDHLDQEMYELVCRERFDQLEQNQHDILDLLRGSNNRPGVLDDVRRLSKTSKTVLAVAAAVGTIVVIQFLTWLRLYLTSGT